MAASLALASGGVATAQPAALQLEWHPTGATAITATTPGPQNNSAITDLTVVSLPTAQFVILQLMLRDTANGAAFPWAFGDGNVTPSSNINGVGVFLTGGTVHGAAGAFFVASNTTADHRLVTIPGSENPTGNTASQPFQSALFNLAGADLSFQMLSFPTQGNPYENGDFPRNRGNGEYLMPYFNARFTIPANAPAGDYTISVGDYPTGSQEANNEVGGPGGSTLADLDPTFFGGSPNNTGVTGVLSVHIVGVPEPSALLLAAGGLAVVVRRQLDVRRMELSGGMRFRSPRV